MKKRYRKSGGVILRSCQMRSFLGIGSRCRKGGEWTDWENNVSGGKSGFGRHEIGEGVRAIWRCDGNTKSCRANSHRMDDGPVQCCGKRRQGAGRLVQELDD